MEAQFKSYDLGKSVARLDEILAAPAGNFEEVKSLPSRDKLTYANGYYANCSAIFIDIRKSSELPGSYNRPQLARIYRAFISEMVAVVNSHTGIREVNIVGDCVWGVADTPLKTGIDELFNKGAKAASLVKILNYKLDQKGYKTPLRIGVGMSYGRALMIKAGYSGSGINEVVYMGDVVNEAAHLAAAGDSGGWGAVQVVSDLFFTNLNDDNQAFCTRDFARGGYSANVINSAMENWLKAKQGQ